MRMIWVLTHLNIPVKFWQLNKKAIIQALRAVQFRMALPPVFVAQTQTVKHSELHTAVLYKIALFLV